MKNTINRPFGAKKTYISPNIEFNPFQAVTVLCGSGNVVGVQSTPWSGTGD